MIPAITRSRARRYQGIAAVLAALLMLAACGRPGTDLSAAISAPAARHAGAAPAGVRGPRADADANTQVAIFAGGCFWCMQPPYDALPGVISTEAGYTGGHVANPTYEQVSAGGTGHAEAVRITFDPRRIDYPKLLDVFWQNIDPVAVDRQFCDVGDQYRSAIFPVNDAQRRQAVASKQAVQADPRFQQPIATRIEPAATFYPAEDYHQDYYRKNPIRYKYYRYSCGRDRRLEEIWGT